MKLRLDLLEHLTMEDIAEVAIANNPRYKPEPLFSQTGTGSLVHLYKVSLESISGIIDSFLNGLTQLAGDSGFQYWFFPMAKSCFPERNKSNKTVVDNRLPAPSSNYPLDYNP